MVVEPAAEESSADLAPLQTAGSFAWLQTGWKVFQVFQFFLFNNFSFKRVRISLISFSESVFNLLCIDVKKVAKFKEKKFQKLFDQVYKNV